MFDIIKTIWEMLKGRSEAEITKISAYILAPGLVLGLSMSGIFGGGLTIDLEKPFSISELKTQLSGDGILESKHGIVLIAEPVSSEYRIQLGAGASRIWSSLDEETARANANRLVLDNGGGFNGKTPLIGVNYPVTIVVEGDLDNIQVPGGTERTEDLRLYSRRSNSIVSGVLLVCVFALGMSLVFTGLPSVGSNQNTTT
jgi:hypothetical protein